MKVVEQFVNKDQNTYFQISRYLGVFLHLISTTFIHRQKWIESVFPRFFHVLQIIPMFTYMTLIRFTLFAFFRYYTVHGGRIGYMHMVQQYVRDSSKYSGQRERRWKAQSWFYSCHSRIYISLTREHTRCTWWRCGPRVERIYDFLWLTRLYRYVYLRLPASPTHTVIAWYQGSASLAHAFLVPRFPLVFFWGKRSHKKKGTTVCLPHAGAESLIFIFRAISNHISVQPPYYRRALILAYVDSHVPTPVGKKGLQKYAEALWENGWEMKWRI